MPNGDDQLKRVKELRAKQATAANEAAADEAQLQVFEQQRDALYARCRELKVEPQNIKQEITDRTASIDQDLERIQERFDGLRRGDTNGG